jgi:LysM repeat protein
MADMHKLTAALLTAALATMASQAGAQTLTGSRTSMERQHQVAVSHGYVFAKTASTVNKLVEQGDLLRVQPTRHFELHNVSFPYAKAPVKLFIEQLSAQYVAACGEKLTVTSLTRPLDRQPGNAADDSVHPTGMAVDLRIPPAGKCRSWLERQLLSLESAEVLDVTRERNPPHYHVAVYPEPYRQFAEATPGSGTGSEYVVRRGDTLSRIASITGASVAQLKSTNGLRNDILQIGQKLAVPASNSAVVSRVSPSANAQIAAVSEVTHRVKRGDTLWRIAKQYGTTVNALSSENGLNGAALQIGQVLKVKAGGSAL